MYKISFLDENGEEFMGTLEHFTTDGRYSFETIDDIARDTARKLLKRDDIKGYVIRRNSFNSPVIKKVTLWQMQQYEKSRYATKHSSF